MQIHMQWCALHPVSPVVNFTERERILSAGYWHWDNPQVLSRYPVLPVLTGVWVGVCVCLILYNCITGAGSCISYYRYWAVPSHKDPLLALLQILNSWQPIFSPFLWCCHFKNVMGVFPGGAVVKNPPANTGDMGSNPGPGRSHMPWSN